MARPDSSVIISETPCLYKTVIVSVTVVHTIEDWLFAHDGVGKATTNYWIPEDFGPPYVRWFKLQPSQMLDSWSSGKNAKEAEHMRFFHLSLTTFTAHVLLSLKLFES